MRYREFGQWSKEVGLDMVEEEVERAGEKDRTTKKKTGRGVKSKKSERKGKVERDG